LYGGIRVGKNEILGKRLTLKKNLEKILNGVFYFDFSLGFCLRV